VSTDFAQSTTSGLSPRTLAALAYAAWWVTGLVVLGVERAHTFVRFHAWQSVIGLGAIWALGVGCYFAAFLVLSVSAAGFTAMLWMAMAIWAVGLGAWGVCVYKAWIGEKWKLPLIGEMAERRAWGKRGQSPFS
jgi:uncharacterized membrane protein